MPRKAIYKHATEVDATTYPDDGSSPVGTTEWNESPDAEGMFGNTPQTTTVSIATGDLTVTDSVTVAAAETGTTDTLDKLLITNTNEYDLIYLFAKTGQTITLTNTSSPSVSGQVKTISGADEVLSTTKPTILIRTGNYWYGYGGGTTADGSVTNVKLADMAANTVKVRDASSSGVPSDKAVADTEILIGDGTGFTAAALSGDATMTNAGVVTVSSATTVTTNANLTGVVTSTGNATAIANGAIAIAKLATDPLEYSNMTAPSASVAFNSQKLTGLADGAVSTDAATKGQLDTAVASNITLKGGYNASTNTPNLDSTPTTVSAGDHYVVTTAGTFYSESLQEGDSLIASSANPTTFAGWIITNNNVVTPITNAQVATAAAIDQSKIASLTTDLGLKAALASPTFTGTLTADNLTATGTLTATLTGTATNVTGTVAISTGGTGATTRQAGIDALTDSSSGTTGHVLTRDSSGNAVFAAAAGGGAVDYTELNTNSSTTYEGSAQGTRFATLGQGVREIYIKKIDANNEGVFTLVYKNGTVVEVQIA